MLSKIRYKFDDGIEILQVIEYKQKQAKQKIIQQKRTIRTEQKDNRNEVEKQQSCSIFG